MEQDYFVFVFNEEDRKEKVWRDWLISKGFIKSNDYYFTKSLFEYDLDEEIYYNGRREVAEICVELIRDSIYSVNLHFNNYCLNYRKKYDGTEMYGSFHTIDAVANAMKEYLDLRDELIKLQEQEDD